MISLAAGEFNFKKLEDCNYKRERVTLKNY